MKKKFTRSAFNLAWLLLGICDPSSSRAEVTQGYPDVQVIFLDANFMGIDKIDACTGTFIHPKLLLTAAHCVRKFNSAMINNVVIRSEDMNGRPIPDVTAKLSQIFIKGPKDRQLHPVKIHVSDYAIPVLDHQMDVEKVKQDLAILEFGHAVTSSVRPLADRRPREGEQVTIVGFGLHSSRKGQRQGSAKHVGYNVVLGDHWGDQLAVNGASETCTRPENHTYDWSVCVGDSGGPLISSEDGGILGVTTTREKYLEKRGKRRSRKYSFFTDINSPQAREFIQDVLRSVD